MKSEAPLRRVCLILGSLRGKSSSSLRFLGEVDRLLPDGEFGKDFVTVKATTNGCYPRDILESLAEADAIVIAFPLFVYSIPGGLTRLLEDYSAHVAHAAGGHKRSKVYGIVNCAFVMPETNEDAIRVLQNFCRRLELEWRFAVSIGCGPVSAIAKDVPLLNTKLRKGFRDIVADIRRDGIRAPENVLIRPLIPRSVLIFMRDSYERRRMARRRRAGSLSPVQQIRE